MEQISIKGKRRINKKGAAKFVAKSYIVFIAIYGTVAGYNNLANYAERKYDGFIARQALSRNLVDKSVIVQDRLVIDPEKGAEAVANAAKEGAKKGADESIKANLGK